jgi:hypothetical protein
MHTKCTPTTNKELLKDEKKTKDMVSRYERFICEVYIRLGPTVVEKFMSKTRKC